MMITLVDAHAPWAPHESGFDYPQFFDPTENQFSRSCNIAISETLSRQGLDIEHLAMRETHHCTQPCAKAQCPSYRAGLNELAKQCKLASLAISIHIDIAPSSTGGPLCLYKGTDTARQWCLDFLSHIESIGPRRRRGRAPMAGHSFNGAFDVGVPAVKEAFGRKAFLEDGAQEAVIVEIGNIAHKPDRIWIGSGMAQVHASTAAIYATRNTFSIY